MNRVQQIGSITALEQKIVGAFQNEGLYLNLMQRQLAVAPFADALLQGTCSYPRWLAHDSRGKFGLKRLEVDVHP